MAGGDIGSDLIAVTRMNRLKTGALINFAIDAGAMIGCASEAEKTALSRYAHDVGLAFQMVTICSTPKASSATPAKRSARTKRAAK
jgi:farnesyl diphosphate synthase